MYARHWELGLEFPDNLNALDILPVIPEPSAIVLLAVGRAGLAATRRQVRPER